MPGSILKSGARKLIFKNFPRLIIISLIYVVFFTVVSWLSFRLPFGVIWQDTIDSLMSGELPGTDIIFSGFRPVGLLLAVLLSLIQPVLDVGFISYCLKINRNQTTEYKDLLNGFLFFLKAISIFLLTAFFVFLWSLLLIIPGIIASYKYRLAFYILLDDPDKSALQCISESKLIMHGSKLDLLTIDISFIGWYILDFIFILVIPLPFVIPLVSVWIAPYVGLTRAAFYEDRVSGIAV